MIAQISSSVTAIDTAINTIALKYAAILRYEYGVINHTEMTGDMLHLIAPNLFADINAHTDINIGDLGHDAIIDRILDVIDYILSLLS